jgi:hypothetical protein
MEHLRRSSRITRLPKHTTGNVWHKVTAADARRSHFQASQTFGSEQVMKARVDLINKQFSSR